MPVVLEVNAPDHILLQKGGKKMEIDISVSLINQGDQDALLSVTNTDDVMFWHLLDARQKEVQRMPAVGKPKISKDGTPVMEKRVPGQERVAIPETIELDCGKLKHGQSYILRVRAWGRSAEHEIQVCDVGTAPKGTRQAVAGPPRSKKAAAKSSTAKATAAKKTAAKKTSAKKTPAKKATARKPAAKKARKAA